MRWRYGAGIVVVSLGLWWGSVQARPGAPVVTTWDYAVTMAATGVTTHFQLQRCAVAACTAACTPVDLDGQTAALGSQWGSAVATGTFAADQTLKTVNFTATTGRYVKLVALSEINGNAWTSAAEINVYNNSTVIPQAQISVMSADSQEFIGENGAAQQVLDGNTATYWHTAWFSASPPHPHTLILDLGTTYQVNRVTYLPRQSGVNGTIAGYEIYVATTLTSTWTDSNATAGTTYRYQIVAVGILDGAAARSDPSGQVCTYVKARERGRPDVLED